MLQCDILLIERISARKYKSDRRYTIYQVRNWQRVCAVGKSYVACEMSVSNRTVKIKNKTKQNNKTKQKTTTCICPL